MISILKKLLQIPIPEKKFFKKIDKHFKKIVADPYSREKILKKIDKQWAKIAANYTAKEIDKLSINKLISLSMDKDSGEFCRQRNW